MLAFFDPNVLVYSAGNDAKARTARSLLAEGGMIGTPVAERTVERRPS